jgi:hypothetical protein
MPIAGRRPFSENVEVAQKELVREQAPGEEPKYQGMVNQIYSNDLPQILPELFIKKEAYVTLVADYTVGTVTVGTGTSNIIGTSTSWTSAVSDGFLIRVGSADVVYRMNFANSVSLTFQDSLTWIASSGTGLSYTLFKDRYALPSDFGSMIVDDPEEPHVVYRYVDGQKLFLNQMNEEMFEQQANVVGTPYAYCVKWIKETPYLYLTLAADSVEIVGYSYIPQLTTLTEYTSGTVTFTASTAVIATTAASWAVNVTTGTSTYYIRNDADGTGSSSKWAKILSVANATALTLESTWGFTTGAGQTYTIAEISKWPARFDDAMLYKTALIVDPDNLNVNKWNSIYLDAIGMDKAQETRRSSSSTFKAFPGLRKKTW